MIQIWSTDNNLQQPMQKNSSSNKEEGQIHSVFDETMNALNKRAVFFPSHQISNETQLLKASNTSTTQVKSIANILPILAYYSVVESPLQPQLRDLYTAQYDQHLTRCVLPPPSDGEKSVNIEDNSYQPTFKWLSSTLIDSTRLEVDEIEPKKVEKGKVPEQWTNITQLLIFNIQKKIHLPGHQKELSKALYSMFTKFPWVKIKKIKFIYYKGKGSALLRFSDSNGSLFAYYNLIVSNQSQRKQQLGQNSKIFRVVSNRLKLQQDNRWVAIVFRRLPTSLVRENFISSLKKSNLDPIWVEELVQIQNYKYSLCTVSFLQEAFRFCQVFQTNSPFKEVKVNLHPKSKKIWSNDSHELLT